MSEERYPQTYGNMVSQTYDYHPSGGCYTRIVTITTHGADHTDDWETMTEEQRDEHDAWVADYHDATVDIAEAEPEVRQRVADMIADGPSDADGDTLRRFLKAAEKAAEEAEAAQ